MENIEIITLEDSSYSKEEETQGFELSSGNSWYYPINYPIREYQYKIVESALYNNTLVCLPTGLGKTFIAAVVMYNFSRWYPKGKVVFMAPTRPLVAQQIQACHDVMGIPAEQIAELTGTINQNHRLAAWVKKRIIFATPQIFHNDLDSKIIPFSDIKCVVIDEAHKALGKHSYCEAIRILSEYNKFFRILALSATPGNSLEKVHDVITNLHISNLEIRDETSSDIIPYINDRKIEIVLVCLSRELQIFKNRYIEIMDPHVKVLIQNKILNGSTANISKGRIFFLQKSYQENKQSGGSNPLVQKAFSILLTMTHAYELLQKHGLRAFYNFYQNHSDKYWMANETKLHALLEDINNYLGEFPLIQMLPNGTIPDIPPNIVFGHTKFEKLKSLLTDHFENASSENRDTRSIVFVEFKDSVKEVYVLLLQCRPLIRPQMFVGQSDQKQKVQLQALEDFKNNKVNVLISTSVGEEGLDVGEVDLIICFDGCQRNPSRLVQRMGRTGRKRSGQIFILVTDGKEFKDLKATLNKKDTFNNKVLQSSNIVSSMYENNPRMVPANFNPTCLKIKFNVQPKMIAPSKKRKQSTIEKKRSMLKSKEKPGSKSKLTDVACEQLSQGSQTIMNQFFAKTNLESKNFSKAKTYDGEPIKNSEIRLLCNDEMGLEFLTSCAIAETKPKSNQREISILQYIPRLLRDDDSLPTYTPPNVDILKSMASWKREEVSSLWNSSNDACSDDEDQVKLNYDDDNQYSPIIIQTQNTKYNRNEDMYDSRFPSEDLFNNINDFPDVNDNANSLSNTNLGQQSLFNDNFPNISENSNSCLKTEHGQQSILNDNDNFPNTSNKSNSLLNTKQGKQSIFNNTGNFLNTSENLYSFSNAQQGQRSLLNDSLNSQLNRVSIFEDLLKLSSEDETLIEATEIKKENKLNGGMFDELLLDSSSEEEQLDSKPPIEKSENRNATVTPNTIMNENSSSNYSEVVSQALMEVREMSSKGLDLNSGSLLAQKIDLSQIRVPIDKPKTADFSSETTSKIFQSQKKVFTIEESVSDEDMFIDDDFSDEVDCANISEVVDTQKKQPFNRGESLPTIEDVSMKLSATQNRTQKPLSLTSRNTQSQNNSTQNKAAPSKPSLSITKRQNELNDDFEDAFRNVSISNNRSVQSVTKQKLSLNNLSKEKTSSSTKFGSSKSNRHRVNVDNFSDDDDWEDAFKPIVDNEYFDTNKNENNNTTSNGFPSSQLSLSREDTFSRPNLPSTSHSTSKNPGKSLFLSRNEKSNEHCFRLSNNENQANNRLNVDDDVFVRPNTSFTSDKPIKTKDNDEEEQKFLCQRNDSFYGTPSRSHYLAKKRNKRYQKKLKSPNKARGFIEDEAEVSIDVDTTDGSTDEAESDEEMNKFVSHTQYFDESHMEQIYLQSTRSPIVRKFCKQENYLPKEMVYSQPFTQGVDNYVNDSFCVTADEEEDEFIDENIREASSPDILEDLERKLAQKKNKRRKRKQSDEKSPKRKKKIKTISSDTSSSEDEMERLRKQIAEESMLLKS